MPKRKLVGHCRACARFVILMIVVPDAAPGYAICSRCDVHFLLSPSELAYPGRYGYYLPLETPHV